ncbi:MAG: hypothetical protein ABIQ16_13770 [Polyangiaceae bacterium]
MKGASGSSSHACNRYLISIRSLLVLLLPLLVSCSDSSHEELRAPGLGVYVEASWRVARTLPGHQIHVGKHQVPCVQCHVLTDNAIGPPSLERCATCHAKEARIEHAASLAQQRFGPHAKADCTSCHEFAAHESDAGVAQRFLPTDCVRCHGQAQGALPAVTIHGSSRCVTCHHPHEDEHPKPAPCANCHQVKATHANEGKTPTQVCTTCHALQHAPAAAALTSCVTCHASTQPVVPATALFAGGHSQCVGCHRPHDFAESKVAQCRSCHADLNVLAAPRVQAHSVCTSCHQPHAVRESALNACASCHQRVHPDHPKFQNKGACVGCHEPHPRSVQLTSVVRACSSCHQTATSEKAFHEAVTCTTCHAPHQFALTLQSKVLCNTCHTREVSLVTTLASTNGALSTGHAACQGCHKGLPHHPKGVTAACGTCHGAVEAKTNQGHRACTNCHEPHSGQRQAACGNCHAKEQTSAPLGHQVCTNCHEPHSGTPTGAVCARCHANEAQSKHGQLAGACASCHRPHGPNGLASPPACTNCHQSTQLAGLHSVRQHQACTKCHGGHESAALQTRAPCLACHADRKDHFPDAPRCASCHLFDRNR